VNDTDGLPFVLFEEDLARVLRCNVRTVQRLDRAGLLPQRMPIPGRPRWTKPVTLDWLAGGGPYGRGRRHGR
jgi:hypothetical protein